MKARLARRFTVAVLVGACGLLLAAIAYADVPVAQAPSIEGVAHHWVTEQMKYAPYTEPTAIERGAKTAATAALAAPADGLIRQADHGYASAQEALALGKLLKGADPIIVGHELVVWNADRAARLYVNNDGLVKVVEVGPVREQLVSQTAAASDQGERDAIEIAKAAFNVAVGLDPKVTPAANGLVGAHAVGFADADGRHLVLRVDLDGNTSYPDW